MAYGKIIAGTLLAMFGATGATADENPPADGQAIYNKECSVCHGVMSANRTGGLARPVQLAKAALGASTMIDVVAPVSFDGDESAGAIWPHPAGASDAIAVVPIYGPTLKGVLGRVAGTHPGYPYSKAFKAKMEGIAWDEAKLDTWIKSSQTMVSGSFMYYSQKNADMRSKIVQYLKANSE